jgi:Rieske 2Fe-2S family protein
VTLLTRVEPTLPARWYLDETHHRRELEAIWYRAWLCAGRADDYAAPGDYRVHRIGDQSIVITRASDGTLSAFHNTCRHRGAELCADEHGRFSRERIVCPYHAWTYSLRGELIATPHRLPSDGFRPEGFGLYRVACATWAGFVFVNLAPPAGVPLERLVAAGARDLQHWPLDRLATAHRESHVIACNWKVFWENFSECYHCPRVHPELCGLVPMYGHAVVSADDDPAQVAGTARAGSSPLASGAVTWTLDGKTTLPFFPDLTEAERAAGMTFVTLLPGMFIIAHADYLRTVRVRPLAAETTELTVEWLLPDEARDAQDFDLERLTALGRLVVTQDARVCEINQRGLRCREHVGGVLVAQEHGVHEFHRWVRAALDDTPSGY